MKKLEEELTVYSASDAYPFHMPGHKRQSGLCHPSIAAAMSLDITEIDGFDNLHAPEGILKQEMQFAAQLFGSRETFFSVNGSTGAILTAISAAVPRESEILIERSCHISVYHAAYLRDLKLHYIDSSLMEQVESGYGKADPAPVSSSSASSGVKTSGIATAGTTLAGNAPAGTTPAGTTPAGTTPAGGILEEGALAGGALSGLAAVVITSPSYEGYVKNVSAWAHYAHSVGALLIVDEAHGAHFSMHPYFPCSAIRCGADLVVQSLHKTLPSLTQTALLHRVTDRVSSREIQRFLDIYETSSPSYVLMASITSCLHAIAEGRNHYFDAYVEHLQAFRKKLSESLHCLRLEGTGSDVKERDPRVSRYDPGKILITVPAVYSGAELYHTLRQKYRLQPEMCGDHYVLLMTSPADTKEGFDRLKNALLEIDAELQLLPEQGFMQQTRVEVLPDQGSIQREGAGIFMQQEVRDVLPWQESIRRANTIYSSSCRDSFPPAVLPLSIAADAVKEQVPLEEAEGRICADYVIAYPPDSPLIVPGEVYTKSVISLIKQTFHDRSELEVYCIADDLKGAELYSRM